MKKNNIKNYLQFFSEQNGFSTKEKANLLKIGL